MFVCLKGEVLPTRIWSIGILWDKGRKSPIFFDIYDIKVETLQWRSQLRPEFLVEGSATHIWWILVASLYPEYTNIIFISQSYWVFHSNLFSRMLIRDAFPVISYAMRFIIFFPINRRCKCIASPFLYSFSKIPLLWLSCELGHSCASIYVCRHRLTTKYDLMIC